MALPAQGRTGPSVSQIEGGALYKIKRAASHFP